MVEKRYLKLAIMKLTMIPLFNHINHIFQVFVVGLIFKFDISLFIIFIFSVVLSVHYSHACNHLVRTDHPRYLMIF